MQDIRWKQRFENYKAALSQLQAAVGLSGSRELSLLEKQGLIQAFEFTHELSWNLMKDYFLHQGNAQITGSRDAAREAFQRGLLEKGEVWMEMIRSRNQTSHTYNRGVADAISEKICTQYLEAFESFAAKMQVLAERE